MDLARAGCVCTHWYTSARDELLWKVHARQLYYIEELVGPDQESCVTWRWVCTLLPRTLVLQRRGALSPADSATSLAAGRRSEPGTLPMPSMGWRAPLR